MKQVIIGSMKKALLILTISIFIIAIFSSCSDFNKKGKPLFKDILELHEASLTKCKTIELVWSNAIYDKKYALSTSEKLEEYYVSDFNVAIYRMENEPTINILNTKIDSLSSKVVEHIELISDKKNVSYDKLLSLYTNVIELSKNARSPNGSLQSFSDDVNEKENQINMLITEIEARNPEFKD
ncbi:hypothetical protein [Chryseobacterium sp. SIMBA_028]|uniref:hypothetical protein n=1 Tax=Chryseobacterium sp. SIMBA_028 TaxID=3085771 RepID=UPI00397D83A7